MWDRISTGQMPFASLVLHIASLSAFVLPFIFIIPGVRAQYDVVEYASFTITNGVENISITYLPSFFTRQISGLDAPLVVTNPIAGCDSSTPCVFSGLTGKAVLVLRGGDLGDPEKYHAIAQVCACPFSICVF